MERKIPNQIMQIGSGWLGMTAYAVIPNQHKPKFERLRSDQTMFPSRRKLSLAEKRARYESRALDIPDYTRENLRELSLVQEFEKRPHKRS
jgi:hypothetical protein